MRSRWAPAVTAITLWITQILQTQGGGATSADGANLRVLIGTSGPAETAAVQDAINRWQAETGHTADLQIASDLSQQLAQGFAAGNPPDLFYVSNELLPGYAANGSLWNYGSQVDADFYPSLVESFTYNGEFYCAPKDFSTLALVINDDLWAEAGLTAADYPTTWEQLHTVAQTLTHGDTVGLTFGPEWQRVGTFMAQAGGGLLDAQGNAAADSPANVQALEFVQTMLADGSAAFPSAVGAGWGGEAFGSGAAAMTIEGNWIVGALAADFPNTHYTVVSLPQGPGGPGTLQFTQCWGIAEDSAHKDEALSFVNYMVSDEQQMQFARDFGVMPSVTTVADQWANEFPAQEAFIRGGNYAQGFPTIPGVAAVIGDFNAQIEGLQTGNPQMILNSVQQNLSALG